MAKYWRSVTYQLSTNIYKLKIQYRCETNTSTQQTVADNYTNDSVIRYATVQYK